jgi:predicted type IV restriction endonuclease
MKMEEQLVDVLKNIKDGSQGWYIDENSVKQHIILPILQAFGWKIFNLNPVEVRPEFKIGKNNRLAAQMLFNFLIANNLNIKG